MVLFGFVLENGVGWLIVGNYLLDEEEVFGWVMVEYLILLIIFW